LHQPSPQRHASDGNRQDDARSKSTIGRTLKAAGISTRPDGSAWTTFNLGDLEYFVDHDFPYGAIAVISGRSQRAIQAGVEKSGLCGTPGALADDKLERVQCPGV
jgi:hypothetical protein